MIRRSLAAFAVALLCAAFPAGASALVPISSFGSFGEGAGQLEAGGLASGPNGDFYVGDFGNDRISQFGPDGTFIRAVGKNVDPAGGDVCTTATGCRSGESGTAAGQFSGVEAIAVGPEGDVYATDDLNNRVEVFTAELQFVRAFGEGVLDGEPEPQVCMTTCRAGLAGSGAGEFDGPYGIAVDPGSGEVFIGDDENHRIDAYESDGSFIKAIGKGVKLGGGGNVCTEATGCQAGVGNATAGSLNSGGGIAIPAAAGDLYVVDYGEDERVDQFTQSGEFVRGFGKKVNATDESDICTTASGCQEGERSSAAGGFQSPGWVAFDAAGNLYVSDYFNARVDVYTPEGEFENAFGGGVIAGSMSEEFQTCTAETGCQEGSGDSGPGSVMHAEGIAVVTAYGCNDKPGVYVIGHHVPSPPPAETRIGRFGVGAVTPCAPHEEKHESLKPPPSNRITLGKLKLNKKRGTALLAVSVPGPGALALSGKGVRGEKLHVPGVTTVNLPIALGGKAKKELVKRGKAVVKVTVVFTPDGGTSGSASKSVALKKLPKKR